MNLRRDDRKGKLQSAMNGNPHHLHHPPCLLVFIINFQTFSNCSKCLVASGANGEPAAGPCPPSTLLTQPSPLPCSNFLLTPKSPDLTHPALVELFERLAGPGRMLTPPCQLPKVGTKLSGSSAGGRRTKQGQSPFPPDMSFFHIPRPSRCLL